MPHQQRPCLPHPLGHFRIVVHGPVYRAVPQEDSRVGVAQVPAHAQIAIEEISEEVCQSVHDDRPRAALPGPLLRGRCMEYGCEHQHKCEFEHEYEHGCE